MVQVGGEREDSDNSHVQMCFECFADMAIQIMLFAISEGHIQPIVSAMTYRLEHSRKGRG